MFGLFCKPPAKQVVSGGSASLFFCRQVKGAFYFMISWKYKLLQGRIRFVFYCGYPLIKTQLFADVLQRYHSFPRTMLESRG